MALTKVSGHIIDQPFDVGILTATNQYVSGIGTFGNIRVLGDLQVDGTTTTLDTVVTSVDRLEVGANNTTVGVAITQSGTGDIFNLYDGSSEVFSVADGGTVTVTGNIVGVTSAYATKFYGDGSNITNLAVDATKIETGNTKVETIDTGSDGHVKVTTEGTERLRVQKGGNVTIGTTVEDTGAFRTFHIHGDYTRIKLTDQFSGTGNTDGLDIQCTGGSAYYKFYENGHVYFSSNNTNRLQITNTGDIKVLTAGAMLDGNTNLLLSVSGTERVRIGSSGEIGIGGTNYGTSGQVLTSGGNGSAPSWTTLSVDSDKISEGNTEAEVIDTGSNGHFKVTTEGTERVIINGDGSNSVKVGTAATLTGAFTNLQLHNASGASRIVLTDQFTGTTTDDGFHIQCSGGGATFNLKENSHIYYRTNGLLRASLKNSGEFKMHGSNPVVFGDNEYFKIYYDGSCNIENTHSTSNFFIASAFGMQLRVNTSEPAVSAIANGKVQLFYDGSEKFETSSSGVKALGTLNLGSYQNSGLTYSPIYDSAHDIFVYDTRKDSDGGAWRRRTQHTTWYNETLNTSTRGSRREFPAVAVIVSQTNKVTIYDGDDPTMPMWMVFNTNGIIDWPTTTLSRIYVSAVNGIMATATNDGGHLFKFVEDFVDIIYNSNNYPISSDRSIGARNNATSYVNLTDHAPRVFEVSNFSMRDVTMTVLPNAPIDERTGLPTPSVVVATDTGLSVIHNDGFVRNLSDNLGATRKFENVITLGSDVLGYNHPNGTVQRYFNALNLRGDNTDNDMKYNYTIGGGGGSTENISAVLRETTNVTTGLVSEDPHNRFTAFNADGISRFIDGTDRSFTANSFTIFDSSVAYITSDYNTGYMHGDIRGAYLSDTSTTTKTNGQTELDRSVFGNDLTVTGSITKSVVATGADLVCYTGFSASNQLNSTTSVNFGNPAQFCITAWFNVSTASDYQYITSIYDSTNSRVCGVAMEQTSGRIYVFDTSVLEQALTNNLADGLWHQAVGVFDSYSRRIYVDGKEVMSKQVSTAPNMSSTSRLSIGHYNYQNNYNYPWLGKLSLVRYSKTIPSKERIKQIYEEERHLFAANAKSTLYGSSNAVTGAAFDNTTNILHAGTSAGRSEISGLRRINNTTTAVTTAISASNELVAEQ